MLTDCVNVTQTQSSPKALGLSHMTLWRKWMQPQIQGCHSEIHTVSDYNCEVKKPKIKQEMASPSSKQDFSKDKPLKGGTFVIRSYSPNGSIEANTMENQETNMAMWFQFIARKQSLSRKENQRSDREATGHKRFVNSAKH
ncbi:hypothetical protein J0S82_002662, partial [Galemys pyrenaicus]